MPRKLRDGREDGFEPLESLNPDTIETFADLLAALRKTGFGGGLVGDAFVVLLLLADVTDCLVVARLSGALTVA